MTTPPESEEEMKMSDEDRINAAVRAGCNAAEVHLLCAYPDCRCKAYPSAIRAALAAIPSPTSTPAVTVTEEELVFVPITALQELRECLGTTLDKEFAYWSSPTNDEGRRVVWRAYKSLEEILKRDTAMRSVLHRSKGE